MRAAWRNNNPEVVKTLINAGSDINAKDKYGDTALIRAVLFNRNSEVVKTLINAGADINAKNNEGKTALDFAMNYEIKRMLLDAAK